MLHANDPASAVYTVELIDLESKMLSLKISNGVQQMANITMAINIVSMKFRLALKRMPP